MQNEIEANKIVGFSKPGIKYIKIAAKLPKVPEAKLIYPVKNALPIIFSSRFSFTGKQFAHKFSVADYVIKTGVGCKQSNYKHRPIY